MLDQAQRLRQLVSEKDSRVENGEVIYTEKTGDEAKVITVTSGKGGVGKSNFVVNLGITLQKMGKSVLIFDADVGMGNDDVLMGFLPKYNVYDVMFKDKQIEDVLIEGPFGIKLLPGGTGISRIDEIDEHRRNMFLNRLGSLKGFDFILMDTGAGINRTVLGFIKCCEELIVVTTPEPTSLTDAYSLVKVVNHFKIKSTAKVVINRVIDYKEGQHTFDKFNGVVNKFLGMDLEHLGSISEDRKLIQAVREQKPFAVNYPNCSAALDINEIALKLCGEKSNKKGEGLQGLFKKIFNIFS